MSSDRGAMLFSRFSERKYVYGENIIKQGDEGNEYFIIKSGSVSVRKELPDGKIKKLAILTSRQAFGEEAPSVELSGPVLFGRAVARAVVGSTGTHGT